MAAVFASACSHGGIEEAVRRIIADRDEVVRLADSQAIELARVRAVHERQQSELAVLRDKEAAADATVAKLSALLRDHAELDVHYTQQLRVLEVKADELESSGKDAAQRVSALQAQDDRLAAENGTLEKLLQQERARSAELQSSLNSAAKGRADAESRAEALSASLDDAVIRLGLAEEDKERRDAEYSSLLKKCVRRGRVGSRAESAGTEDGGSPLLAREPRTAVLCAVSLWLVIAFSPPLLSPPFPSPPRRHERLVELARRHLAAAAAAAPPPAPEAASSAAAPAVAAPLTAGGSAPAPAGGSAPAPAGAGAALGLAAGPHHAAAAAFTAARRGGAGRTSGSAPPPPPPPALPSRSSAIDAGAAAGA